MDVLYINSKNKFIDLLTDRYQVILIFIISSCKMEIHMCTFQMNVKSVKSLSNLRPQSQPLEVVWRGQKGQIIVIGAVRPAMRGGIAAFNEEFEIKADLLRDPETKVYQPSNILLQIRKTGQSLYEKVSGSTCTFSLADILNRGPLGESECPTSDKGLSVLLSIQCREVEDTKMRKSMSSKNSRKGSKEKGLSDAGSENKRVQEVSRQRDRSKQRKGAKRGGEVEGEDLRSLREQLAMQQAEHVLTQERVEAVQRQLGDQQQVINQLSALVSQRETDAVQLRGEIEARAEEVSSLNRENKIMLQKIDILQAFELANIQMKGRISVLEKEVDKYRSDVARQMDSESDSKKNIGKQKEISIFLSKNVDQLKRENSRISQQKQLLFKKLKNVEGERDKLIGEVASLKSRIEDDQKQLKQQLKSSFQRYNQLFDQFSKLRQEYKAVGFMVDRQELQRVQKQCQQKIAKIQQKQSALKQHVQSIQKQIVNLQDLLQEKEQNEQVLIQHSRKLQHELDTINYEKNWWLKIIGQNQSKQPYLNGKTNGNTKNDQLSKLQEKVKQLMQILQQSSKQLLQSQKNKREIDLLLKEMQEQQRRQTLYRDQSKQLKERVGTLLKENKKMFQKMTKVSKQNQILSKTNRLQLQEIEVMKQREKQVELNQSLMNNRLQILQNQIAALRQIEKSLPTAIQPIKIREVHYEPNMGVIREMSEQMASSVHRSRKGSENEPREMREFDNIFVQELSDILRLRESMMDMIVVQMQEMGRAREGDLYGAVDRELKKLGGTVNKVKVALMRSGQKEVIKDLELSVRSILTQIQRLKNQNK